MRSNAIRVTNDEAHATIAARAQAQARQMQKSTQIDATDENQCDLGLCHIGHQT